MFILKLTHALCVFEVYYLLFFQMKKNTITILVPTCIFFISLSVFNLKPTQITFLNFFPVTFFFYYCSSTVVSIFTPALLPASPIPTSDPQTYCLWLCPCVLYTCSLMDLPLFSSIIPLPPPLWLLSVCSLFQCFWLYFVCLFVLLIRFHLQVRSCGICISPPDLFQLAYCCPVPSMLSQ